MNHNYQIESGSDGSLSESNSELHRADVQADVRSEAKALPSTPRSYSAAFEEIWRTHAKQILCITQRITKNREDAEDALQDSFLRAYVHLHSFDGRSSLSTWLTRIAINSALMILRTRKSAAQIAVEDGGDTATDPQFASVKDERPSPEAHYAQLEQQAFLRRGMSALRPSIRRALELQVLQDHSVPETAVEMGLSISATKSRIFHAKAALRKSLAPRVARRGRTARGLQLLPA
jgi:RNA polymerase sigma-70 factor (ECF subfamily)